MYIELELKRKSLNVEIDNIKVIAVSNIETYDGDYTFTSTFTPQTYRTRNKTMTNNITINTIPVHTVANITGGNTVTIGDA